MMLDIPVAGRLPRIYEVPRTDLERWCDQAGVPAYRIHQWQRWIFTQRVHSFQAMLNLPQDLRQRLAENFTLFPARVARHLVARDRTEKLLLQLTDGEWVECVLMRETAEESGEQERISPRRGANFRGVRAPSNLSTERRTVCISTQVGCAMGCVFCASGLRGLKRNLTTGEILEQVLRLDRLLAAGEKITNVVVMGIGEPLANLKALLPALDCMCDPHGLGLSPRRITISTVGLPEKIVELSKQGKPYNLAISLHAPNDALRNRLVPVNARIGIEAILRAADEYVRRTGRRVTYEYVLLAGVNDGPEEAQALGRVLQSRLAHVNLIPMNRVTELPFVEPSAPRTAEFVQRLQQFGVAVTVRKRKGADIDAACGQLRLQQSERQESPDGEPDSAGEQAGGAPRSCVGVTTE